MNLTSIRCGKKRPIRQPQENNNFNTVFNVSVESAAASFVKDSRRRELIIIDLDDDVENVNNCCVDAEAQKSLCGPDDYRFGISPSSVVARTTGNCTVSNQSESTQAVCLTPMAILPVDHSLGPPEGGESIRCVICQLDLSLNDVTDRVNHVNACLDSLESPPKHAQGMDTVDVDELEVYVPNGPEDGDLQSVVGLTASELCCVVCGLDISKRGLFSRCFHIKRCAREHMISVKDVIRMLSDHDDITDKTDDNETDLIRSDHALSVAPIAAVHNINSVLMQNAKNSVKMTGKLSNPNDRSAVHQMKQSSEERNVNNLLMSAAREAVAVNKRGIEESKDMVKRGKSKRAYTGGWGNTWNKDAAKGTLQENYAPDYKKIQYDTLTIPIVVDGFHYTSAALTDTYFLTHFHSDHYGGLTSKFNCGRIYCSPATSALTQLRLRVPPSVLVPLALEIKHTIVIGGAQVAVTLIDANHCPGAVLLLFEFRNGKKVLHTGDFRYNREMLMRSAALRELSRKESNPRNLVVYLDTTYCDPQYCFPDQSSAIQAVIETVRNEMKNETETSLFAFGAYGIGKERVFMAVAQALNLKVFVDGSRWKAMMCYDWSVSDKARLTTDSSVTSLWVVSMSQINFKALNEIRNKANTKKPPRKKTSTEATEKQPYYSRVVGFQPTGWSHKPSGTSSPPLVTSRYKGKDIIHSVPYSEHSSFSELIEFVDTFRPQRIIPTVSTQKDKVKIQLDFIKQHSSVYTT